MTPGVSIANLVLRDIAVSGSYRTAFDLHAVNGATLDGLTALNTARGNGIQITGCTDVTLTDCTTSGNAWGGVALYNSTYSASSCANVTADLADNNFGEVQAIYVQDPGVTGLNITGYSYVIASSATTTYADGDVNEAIALALFYDSLGSAATTITEADGDPVLYAGETGTAIVYVDDDWAGTVSGAGVQKPDAPAGTYLWFGHNAFATIQSAVVGVAESGTVHIANGLYLDSNTTLDKAMTLVGQSRDGVVVAPAAEDENLTTGGFTGVYQHGFVIAASDVTVTNLTIDGKANAALTEGKCNFRAGVMANGDIHSNVILASLTVRNTYLYGINMRIGTIGQGGAGSAIRSCWVENMGFNAYPSYGIYSTHAGVIAGNTVTNAGYRGIYVYSANMDVYDNTVWTGDYDPVYGSEGVCIVGDVNGNLSPAPVTRVYRNTIHVRNNVVKGIGMNVLYGLSSTFIGGDSLEDGNVIRLDGGSAADDGIECWWTKTGQPVIQNNTVYADNEDSAVWMFINRSKTEPVDAAAPIFKGNRFYATNSDGTVPGRGTAVFMTDDMRFFGDWMDGACYAILKGNLIDGFARGIDLYRSGDGPEDYDGREHTVQAVIGGANPADANTIQNCGVGVRLFVHPDAYDGPLAKVCDATILGNTTTFAGNDIAILIDGGSASVSQNGLYDNGIAIQAINGGSLTALDENTFEGGATHDDNGTDLLISATAGSVTIGTGNAFAGDLNFIDNRSVQNFDLTANSTTFDVADPYAIEDLVYHKVDEAACGLVRYAANKIYVTQSSGSIQRGIDAASAGDTVHVGAGTYLEQVTIAKALTVIGLDGAVLDGTGLGTTAVGVRIKSGNVTFDNVDVVSYQGNGIICGYEASIPGGLPNICIVNCRIADIQPGNSHGFGIYVGYESEGFGYVPPKLTAHLDYSGLLIASNEIVNTKCSGLVLQSITGTPGSLVVCDNNIHGITANSGIWVDCARNLVIEGNTVAGNKWGIEFSAYAEFGTLNGPYGPRDIVVRNNFVSGNAQQGLALYEGWPSTIAITQNSITGNGTGLQNYLDATVSAENNWWGNQTGPASTANPGGLGDTVVGSVDFSSWLGDGTDSSTAPGFQPNLTPVYYLPLGLKFTASPANAALGGSLGTVTVQVTNELGAVAAQFTGDVALAIGSQPGSGVLTGTLTKPCAAGEVSFSDLAVTVDGGTGFTLAASAAPPIAGAVSAAFDIANPLPELGSMSPIFAAAGSGDLTLTLSGSAFVGSSVVKWGAAETVLVPASVTADSMTVTVPAALLTTAGTAAVKVFSPAEGGGTSSDLTFTITATALAPEVWVDDDWTGYGYCGGKTWGYDAFRTIQSAVNGVAVGGTIHVLAGLYEEDVDLNKANLSVLGAGAEAVTVMGQIGGIGQTVKFSAEGILLDGLTITRDGNTVEEWTLALNDAGIHIQGRSSGTVRNCRITGMRTAIDINASSNLTIRNNDITFNRTGMILRNTTDNLTVVENKITDNWTVGVLFLDASGGDNDPIQRAANCTFSNNAIFGNWYGDIVDRQTGGSLPAPGANLKNFSGNWLGTVTPVVATVNSTEPGYAVQIPVAYGGEASNPGSAPNILGTASANIDYSPWLAVGTDTDGGALGFKGDFDTLWVDDDSPQTGAIGRIQEGANLVVNGGTVNVAAGTYAEDVVITTPLTLLGPNADKTGFDAARVGEAILIPSEMKVDLDEPYPGKNDFTIVAVQTNNVTISGFTFCGDNPDIDGFDHAGMNVELGNAVISQGHNVVLRNNIVDQFTKCGFKAKGTQQTTWQGLVVDGNLIKNVHDVNPTGYGMGLYVQGTAGKVTNNVIRDCRLGMQIQPYQIVGDTVLVRDNTIAGWAISIWYNYAENGASAWSISDNRIRASLAPAAMTTKLPWVGVRMETMRASGNGALIQNNTIDGETAMLDPSHADWDGFDNAVWGAHYRGGSSLSDKMVLIDNVFTNLAFGFVHSAPVDVAFAQNTLHVRDAAIVIQPAGTMTGTESATNNVDATGGNIINGVDTTTATLEQLFAIEDAVNHKVDNPDVGLVRIREDNLYVTTSSGSIQRGIDAATAGDTVNVAAGTYNEALSINKPYITVLSHAGPGETIIDVPDGSLTRGVTIYKNLGAVTLDGFTIQNFTEIGVLQGYRERDGTAAHIWNNIIIPAGDYLRSGIQVAGDGSTVKGNTVYGARLTEDWLSAGIHLVDNSNMTVENNTVVGLSEYGMDVGIAVNSEFPCTNIVIRNNFIQNADYAFEMTGYPGGVIADIDILHNHISDYEVAILNHADGIVSFGDIRATQNWWGA